MIDTNFVFATFERDTKTDPFFNSNDEEVSKAADMIRKAISNDFTIKYNNDSFISLGFYSQDNYTIKYPYRQEDTFPPSKRGKMSVKTNRTKYIDYFFLNDSDFKYIKDKRTNSDKWLRRLPITNYFLKIYNIPKNEDFYLIWRTEIYLDGELYRTYDQKIRFVYKE
jgi:hypothetical protein